LSGVRRRGGADKQKIVVVVDRTDKNPNGKIVGIVVVDSTG